MDPFRVRQVLDNLDKESKRLLKLCIPKAHRSPPKDLLTSKGLFPHAIKTFLPSEHAHSMLGVCTESLLQLPAGTALVNTTLTQTLRNVVEEYEIKLDFTDSKYTTALKSATTQKYLEHLELTRMEIAILCRREKLEYNRELVHSSGKLVGHPDIMTHTKILEIKASTNIKAYWEYMVMQVMSYSAIVPSYTQVYLVFPLQEYIYHIDLTVWPKRSEFLQILLNSIDHHITSQVGHYEGQIIRQNYFIGSHVSREKQTIHEVLKKLPNDCPWQLFLESNLVTKKTISDNELAQTLNVITSRHMNVYVHSPYTINLCTPHEEKDSYHYHALQKNLVYAKSMGMKGVVVHVGKSTKLEVSVAMQNMKNFIKLCLLDATSECPLLLETPAGQGTELLTNSKDFADFILEMNDPRLAVCVDLCHVFSAGEIPSEYLQVLFDKGVIPKLIHFNDSVVPKGSCKDLHEQVGKGKIGISDLKKCAIMCSSRGIPMLNE